MEFILRSLRYSSIKGSSYFNKQSGYWIITKESLAPLLQT